MPGRWNRRDLLKGMAAVSAAAAFPTKLTGQDHAASEAALEVQLTAISQHTVRVTLMPIDQGKVAALPSDGSLVQESWDTPTTKLRSGTGRSIAVGAFQVSVSFRPVTISIATEEGNLIQRFTWDDNNNGFGFLIGGSSLLGLGEGGPQFDRRGSVDLMRNGQGAYKLATHGGRVAIPWIIGTEGWAIFCRRPYGTFDFTGAEGRFHPATPQSALPLDLFLVGSRDPAIIMGEYARLTGYPEMPPLWSFGYQQSHRTLASREEILSEAKTFREKKLPCDALIYLGTGFCPSGWNTENGSFVWNSRVFPDPDKMINQLHEDHFRIVLHAVILSDRLEGSARDRCELLRFDEAEASCYWNVHRKDFAMGVDGWWPDEGDPLDVRSRLVRNRMYWEGPQLDRPNERPYALHRNGYAGMQRYASFLWSGDIYSTWETLKTQIPVGLNTSLSGIPYWGTDVGGFVPTPEFTAELYLRWFQFGAFCPLFRCHGRTWKLRLPWGWNTGDPGPVEITNYDGAAVPDASQLHDARVEPICRKYLELRYRMLPYLYSAVRECATTGMPIMRALWLHFPGDPKAVACGDQYLWGKSLLVAPVVEKGATTRRVYLPGPVWFDYWTGERVDGGREIERPLDLETIPLYVRAGSILPLGPVKQFVNQRVEEPLSLSIYPGADASFLLYEDDGGSFNYRDGEWMGIRMEWKDDSKKLNLSLAPGSRVLSPMPRAITARIGEAERSATFKGSPLEIRF
ncbi:MAG TPA: TIM-barrel domain-containing protein [Terriglobales bacterium]|nr:TIM-barrel domain-containing protein [Terriglobales bacterium]